MAKAGVAYIDVEGNFGPFQQGLDGILQNVSQKFAGMGGVGTRALAGVGLTAAATDPYVPPQLKTRVSAASGSSTSSFGTS